MLEPEQHQHVACDVGEMAQPTFGVLHLSSCPGLEMTEDSIEEEASLLLDATPVTLSVLVRSMLKHLHHLFDLAEWEKVPSSLLRYVVFVHVTLPTLLLSSLMLSRARSISFTLSFA